MRNRSFFCDFFAPRTWDRSTQGIAVMMAIALVFEICAAEYAPPQDVPSLPYNPALLQLEEVVRYVFSAAAVLAIRIAYARKVAHSATGKIFLGMVSGICFGVIFVLPMSISPVSAYKQFNTAFVECTRTLNRTGKERWVGSCRRFEDFADKLNITSDQGVKKLLQRVDEEKSKF